MSLWEVYGLRKVMDIAHLLGRWWTELGKREWAAYQQQLGGSGRKMLVAE